MASGRDDNPKARPFPAKPVRDQDYVTSDELFGEMVDAPMPTRPTPTLAQFQRFVKDGKVHYFISSNFGVPGGGQSGTGTTISTWVQAHYRARTVSGVTIYDLSQTK